MLAYNNSADSIFYSLCNADVEQKIEKVTTFMLLNIVRRTGILKGEYHHHWKLGNTQKMVRSRHRVLKNIYQNKNGKR